MKNFYSFLFNLQCIVDYKPHASGDFFKTLFFALFFETTLSAILKSHHIHAAYNRVNTVAVKLMRLG